MKLTQEDIKILSKYENNFRTAINANYTRNIPTKELEVLAEIYNRVSGNTSKICLNCSTQVLALVTKLGKLYNETITTEVKETKANGRNKRKSK